MNTTAFANFTTPAPTQIIGYNANTDEFVSQLKISIPISIVLILVYCIVRRIYPNTFELRRKLSENLLKDDPNNNDQDEDDYDMDAPQYDIKNEKESITFPTISNGFFSWMYDVWMMDSNTFYIHAGFDALVFRLYLKGCLYICFASLPYALLILLPVYGTSELKNDAKDPIDLISLNTVKPGSNRLYAAVIGSYVFSCIALYYLSKVYLAVAYATDQFLIGSNELSDIDSITWFNYKVAIDNVIDFNISLAKKPIGFVGDIYSKGNKLINKTQLKYGHSQSHSINNKSGDVEMDDLLEDDEEQKMMVNIDEENELNESEIIESISNQYTKEELESIIPRIDRYTVMFRDLPQQFRDELIFTEFMKQLFPNKIAHIVVVPNVDKLNSIHKQIKHHKLKLKKLSKKHQFNLNDLYIEDKMDKLPQIYEGTKCCGCCGDKVDLIKYHKTNKDALISKFNKIKKEGLSPSPTAFVIFNSLKEAANCVSSPIRFGLKTLKTSKAPYPTDVLWNNLKYKSSDLIINNVLVWISMFLLLIFWSIPVAAIQGLANLTSLFKLFGGNAKETLGEDNVATLQGALAVLILDLWLGILPIIGEILTTIQHKSYRGKHEMLVMTKYFDCLVFMVLLVTVVAGSTLNGADNFTDYAKNIIDSMSGIIDTLADGLSNMSVYFLLYVLLNTFLWLPAELYRPTYFIYKKLKIPEPNRFQYAQWYAKTMLILTILLTYSVMNPIMWLLGMVYFIFATFVFTYNLSMSWCPEFETGAKQWPLVFGRIRFAFIISIFTLIGLMTLKQAYICAALLLPLAAFIWIITGNINVKFRTIFRVTSLTSARTKDKQIIKLINNGNENSYKHLGNENKLKYIYLPPIMSIKYNKYKSTYSPPKLKDKVI